MPITVAIGVFVLVVVRSDQGQRRRQASEADLHRLRSFPAVPARSLVDVRSVRCRSGGRQFQGAEGALADRAGV